MTLSPDKFYLEKDQNINVRDRIFSEVAGNILIHREFLNPVPAKLIIEKERVYTENSNKPHGYGLIDPDNFSPFPKNPVIARFFKEIGWSDELGSEVRNIFKYGKIYSDVRPELMEADIFKIIIPLIRQAKKETAQENTRTSIIKLLKENPRYTKKDLMRILNKADGTIKEQLSKLKRDGILKRVGSTKGGRWEV